MKQNEDIALIKDLISEKKNITEAFSDMRARMELLEQGEILREKMKRE